MPIKAIRRLDDLLERAVRSIPPRDLVRSVQQADRRTFFRYFKGYRMEAISRARVLDVLQREVVAGENEVLANIFILAWNYANSDVYEAMRKHVQTINENVEAVERIEDDVARGFLEDLKRRFAPEDIYVCVYLNEVRMSPTVRREILPGRPIPEDSEAPAEAAAADAPAEAPVEAPAADAPPAAAPAPEAPAAPAEP